MASLQTKTMVTKYIMSYYSSPMKRWRADMSLSSLAEWALTPFSVQSKKNGRSGQGTRGVP